MFKSANLHQFWHQYLWFWLQWNLVTIAAFILSLGIIEIGEIRELKSWEGVIGGAIIGFAQSIVLNQRLSQAWLWGVASLLSWGLLTVSNIGAMGWVAPSTSILGLRCIYGLLWGGIGGLGLGITQWLILYDEIPQAWRWLLASPISWGISLALGWTIGGALRLTTGLFLGEVVGLGVTWVISSMMTGFSLVSLLATVNLKQKQHR